MKSLEKLGDASYGIYLIHVPLAILVIHTISRQFPSISLSLLWVVTMLFSLIGGALFGLGEHGIHLKMKKIIKAKRFIKSVSNVTY